MSINLLSKIRNVRYRGLVVATLLRWLYRAGIKIVPYNLYAESNDYLDKANFMERFKNTCKVKIISADDLGVLAVQENLPELKTDFLYFWEQGSSCLCVTSGDRIIGYAWFDLCRCQYEYLPFNLQKSEAYAFNFWTSKGARWVATFLAVAVYMHLRGLGSQKIYSVTEIFNTPAMNLRKKLHSKLCRRFIYVKFFFLFEKNIEIN